MSTKSHTHTCVRCGQTFDCHGDQTRNFDGWPIVVCAYFHHAFLNLCATCDAWINGDDEVQDDAPADRRPA